MLGERAGRAGGPAASIHAGADTNGWTAGDGRRHVLQIVGNAIAGGVERHVENLARFLPRERYRLTCVCPFESAFTATLRRLGCEIFVAPIHDDPPWRSIQLAVEVTRHFGVDLIHAHMPKAHALAGIAGGLARVPVLATVHGMNVTSHELGIHRTADSHLQVVCQEAFAQALAMGVPLDRVTVIRNGVDCELFRPDADGTAFRESIGVPPETPLVGWVGRLSPEKGPDLFIQAAEIVAADVPEARFVLVGDGAMAPRLAAQIERAGLTERVFLAGGRDDMAAVYPAFDLLAQTSRSEGMPYALLEAMASGVPVAATAVGGVPEVVEFDTTGLLRSGGDWGGIAELLLSLLAQPARRRTMGAAARRRAEEWFDVRSSVAEVAALYERLAPRAGAGLRPAPPGRARRAG